MGVILVVGGGGYVGSVLCRELIDRGQAVRVLDRFYFGDQGLSEIRDRVEMHVGDMRAVPRELLDSVECVVNVGGLSNDPTAEFNPKANYEMNTAASIELAAMCREQHVPRYLYASSCSIYDRGVIDESTVTEDSRGNPWTRTPTSIHPALTRARSWPPSMSS